MGIPDSGISTGDGFARVSLGQADRTPPAKRLSITGAYNNQSNPKLTLDAAWPYNNEGQAVSVKYSNTTTAGIRRYGVLTGGTSAVSTIRESDWNLR